MERPHGPPQGESGSGKILVFVVAYEAERHLASVFDRIPGEIFTDPAVHILCIDDASQDRGAEVLMDWVRQHSLEPRITILRNPVNQGYGGNQKLGYRMAVDRGYDLVILLHGDGQYAPELLPEIIANWRSGDADVILGSRMMEPGGARRGGMPLYKWLGNRVFAFSRLAPDDRRTGHRASGLGHAAAALRGDCGPRVGVLSPRERSGRRRHQSGTAFARSIDRRPGETVRPYDR